MDNLSDEQLVKKYLSGQQEALEILIQRYLRPLYNFTYKYVHTPQTAEDVTQETMVKIWGNLKKFDKKRKFKTWAYTIAKNTALDFLKKKNLVPFAGVNTQEEQPESLLSRLVSREPLPDQLMMQIEDIDMINLKVSALPEKYREIISLYYHKGLNFREISQLLRTSIDTIKTRHRRAVTQLKKMLTTNKT